MTQIVRGPGAAAAVVVFEVVGLRERVWQRRRELGFTLQDVGQEMGCKRAAVCRVLSREVVQLSTLERLSQALGVELVWWKEPIDPPVRSVTPLAALRWAVKRGEKPLT